MKIILTLGCTLLFYPVAQAQYQQVNMTVFGMDCAPCAHSIHVSMKGIQGVNSVDVNLNTGLVVVKLAPENGASMRRFNEAIERNGFTHKDADLIVRGRLSGKPDAPVLEVTGTNDHFALASMTASTDWSELIGKTVLVTGTLPQAPKGRVSEVLRCKAIAEAR